VPVSVAYDQWTQFPEFAKFMKGVEAVEAKSETEQNWRVKVFRSRRSWQAKVTEQIPDRRIAWTSEGAKGSTKGAITFHPLADDLTRVMLAMEYYPSGFFEKTGNLWRAGGRRARLDLKNFRRFVMLRGEATGSWRGEIRDGEVVRSPDENENENADEGRGTGTGTGTGTDEGTGTGESEAQDGEDVRAQEGEEVRAGG
ncbi:SRPBCC family protein, partial [Frankia sp. EI5c]|uniref:SRPBCC family protein n=1 Tax=Frankia sp. EI5c TaxID=683316 RepID=UPI001F5BF070